MRHLQNFCVIICVLVTPAFAGDWTQWAGSDRLCVWEDTEIVTQFPEGGLTPAWTKPIGSGYSGPVVADGRIVVTDYRPKSGTKTLEAIERVLCLDEQTGETLWEYEYETRYRRQLRSYATGPRGTPVIHNGHVYAIGATGQVCCLKMSDGSEVWSVDSLKAFNAEVPTFGVSCSPTVWKDTLICTCGGQDGILRALELKTGREKWKALAGRFDMPYSAPEILTFGGDPQLVQWHKEGLSGFKPDTGEQLWFVRFPVQSNMAIARPVVFGNRILVSGFYNGSMVVEVTGTEAKLVWKNGGQGEKPQQTRSLHSVITTPIIEGDAAYSTCSYGELRGISLQDGERLWVNTELTRQGRWGSMFWVKHKDRYFVNNDKGELLIMRFSPDGPEVIDRTQLIRPDTQCGYGPRRFADDLVNWVQPAYANGHVVIRNDSEIRRVSLRQPKVFREPLAKPLTE